MVNSLENNNNIGICLEFNIFHKCLSVSNTVNNNITSSEDIVTKLFSSLRNR